MSERGFIRERAYEREDLVERGLTRGLSERGLIRERVYQREGLSEGGLIRERVY